MKISTSSKLKAFLLLTVFILNIVVGFACVVGVDMSFNHVHHQQAEAAVPHEHTKAHHHGETKDHHHTADHHGNKAHEDNCCKDEIAKIEKADKITPTADNEYSHPQVALITTSFFYNFNITALNTVDFNPRYFVQSYHPPIPDIRIAVQSFQI